MAYYIDLACISIDEFKSILKSTRLLPSWKILEEAMDERMKVIQKEGIWDLGSLLSALKTKINVQEFASRTALPEEYLIVLRRVVKGYHPKPNRICDFPNITDTVSKKLEESGIKNTFDLYDHILTQGQRSRLSAESGIGKEEIRILSMMTDMSRIKWVNHTFAFMLLESGYKTAKEVAGSDPMELHKKINEVNVKYKFYKGTIGMNDMLLVIQSAKMLQYKITL